MSSDSLIGQTIGNYRIISRLGRGGMATVYRARQVSMSRDVAIKIMSSDLAEDPQYEARFAREAEVIANLQHPRVLPVHDFGRDGDHFYLVMRLIEGESLYQRLLRGPLTLAQATRYVAQIAEALDYAHSQGVIHRDLKPNNILIDALDNLYLMDFGLAKLLAATQSLTQTGTVIGTPAYMAPEQWRGEPVDARTDIYALGVILYEMLVGHPPFESDTPFTLMYKHVNDPPPAPREQRPDLPEAIEAVILTALAKSPLDRYPSAGALASDLVRAAQASGLPDTAQLIAAAPIAAPPEPESAPAAEPIPLPALDSPPPAEAPVPLPAIAIPMPGRIGPPPPPIPVPGQAPPAPEAIGGVPERRAARREELPLPLPQPPASAVRRALERVDHSLELALEKVAETAPPLSGPPSDPGREFLGGVQRDAAGVPIDGPAFVDLRRMLLPQEALIGVLDIRGTPRWTLAKRLIVGGLGLNIVGGLFNAGLLSFLGWIAWIVLIVQAARTWRGMIGRYYVGFTAEHVLVLPRDSDDVPQYPKAVSVPWAQIERLRLSDRYVLLDAPNRRGGTLSLGALIVRDGAGGLGPQIDWLPHSAIPGLIVGRGFEVRRLG